MFEGSIGRFSLLVVTSLTSLSMAWLQSSPPSNAQSGCKSAPNVAPSLEKRVIHSSPFGFKFSIPANYRTIQKVDRYSTGDVTIIFVVNPSEFEFLECKRKAGQPTEINAQATVVIAPAQGSDILSHIDKMGSRDQWVQKELIASGLSTKIEKSTVANQPAIVRNAVGMYTTKVTDFLTGDRRYAISVSVSYNTDTQGRVSAIAKANAAIHRQILTTFTFEN